MTSEYPTAAAAAELVTDTPGKAVKPVAIGGGGYRDSPAAGSRLDSAGDLRRYPVTTASPSREDKGVRTVSAIPAGPRPVRTLQAGQASVRVRRPRVPGQGQMKPEQLEIAQLKREVIRLKAERDILKKAAAYFAKKST